MLWSQAYDEDLRVRGFFAIQDDVAQKVATAIGQPYGIIFRADERRERGPDAHPRTWRPMPARCGSTAIGPL